MCLKPKIQSTHNHTRWSGLEHHARLDELEGEKERANADEDAHLILDVEQELSLGLLDDGVRVVLQLGRVQPVDEFREAIMPRRQNEGGILRHAADDQLRDVETTRARVADGLVVSALKVAAVVVVVVIVVPRDYELVRLAWRAAPFRPRRRVRRGRRRGRRGCGVPRIVDEGNRASETGSARATFAGRKAE